MTKQCLTCRKHRALDAFSKKTSSRDGLREQCKTCSSEYAARWRAANLERKRAMDREYAAKNAEYARAKTRAWAAANPERKRAMDRRYYEDRPDQMYFYGAFCRLVDADKIKAEKKAWTEKNAERLSEKRRRFYAENAEEARRLSREWAKANPDRRRVQHATRKASKLKATPAWADVDAMEEWYALARHLTELWGVEVHVDHAIPLRSSRVCGLHWEGNMQLMTGTENMSKGNKFNAG